MMGREEQAAAGGPLAGVRARPPVRRFAHTAAAARPLHGLKYDEAGLPIRPRPTPAFSERVRRLLSGQL
jgi:hypothetical protein